MKKALITGITGQDGSYLADLLLEKGYEVHGIIRRSSSFNTDRIDHLMENSDIFQKTLFIHYGDLTDSANLTALVSKIKPDEVYNLGAQSHVRVSFDIPEYTSDTNALGTLRLLDALRTHCPEAKYYQASTSELYGGQIEEMPPTGFNETTPFHPRSPYAVAKLYALWISRNYKEAYGMFTCNGILFNHESPRRGDTFVTKKITNWCKKYFGNEGSHKDWKPLKLGNVYAKRDWGHAKDFVNGMWMMMQQDDPDDYVLATGETHTIKEFLDECFAYYGVNVEWRGEGQNEKCYWIHDIADMESLIIEIDPKYFRPSEVDVLLGDATKAKTILGWKPEFGFKELVKDMLKE
jgi:GDPmannose 4,6-dehydratase